MIDPAVAAEMATNQAVAEAQRGILGTMGLDTPHLGRRYCPTCEPVVDPREITEVTYCNAHRDDRPLGSADGLVSQPGAYLSGAVAMDAQTNRALCNFIHRKES